MPLGRLIAGAASRSQVIVASHAASLVSALSAEPACTRIMLAKRLGETVIENVEPPAWTWPSR